ncbi:MAG: tRNA lysidine(34) synthetase TilS [Hydrococcus sp. Prado102]|jgi:tRNA(Ile)-lysidine synthase|nr:tRNA lysidine(34) synthetase TilS [Hydrococcus sp. Prado102]
MVDSWSLLHAQVHQTLRQRRLLKKGQHLLVAVSGGQDSLCLIKLLLDLRSRWEWQIAIAHCDHRWSSDVGIADHVEKLAHQWEIPFYLKIAEQINETEAAAREWRYQMLIEIAGEKGFEVIVTGHTKSDRAETFLYNLFRGAGADGLSALSWKRSLTKEIQLVRPLLNVSRSQTGEFCLQFQLPIWEDAANQNLKYARNRIRNDLLPYLQTHFNPQVETTLAQTAELLRADVEYLEASASELLEQATIDIASLNRLYLRRAPLCLQRRVVRQFLQKHLNKAPTFKQVEAITNLINAPNRTRTPPFPGGTVAEVQGDWIKLL